MTTSGSNRVYDTADVARWFRVSVDEVRRWIAERARLTSTGWVVVLDQMVGYRRRRNFPWQFRMRPENARRGTSRPPTAAARARARRRRGR